MSLQEIFSEKSNLKTFISLKNLENFKIKITINNIFLFQEGFGTKIKGIHILNAPSFVDKFVFIVKQGLKEKVANRLHVHNTFEELHKEIPKEVLPKDFGGDGPSCAKLAGILVYNSLIRLKN